MKGWQLAAALCSQKIFYQNKNLFASTVQIKIVQVTKEVLDKSAALKCLFIFFMIKAVVVQNIYSIWYVLTLKLDYIVSFL